MDIMVVIGLIVGAVLLFFKGGKSKQRKQFWEDIKQKLSTAQTEEEALNKPIAELEDDLVEVEVELEDVEDADITTQAAIDLLREQFNWDDPPPSVDE